MEDLIWGEIPTKRTKKVEKYSTPVLTMHAVEKVGGGRKFSFNKAAQELLDIVGGDFILFGYSTTTLDVFVKKSSEEKGLGLTQTCTLSDKKNYEFIAKRLDLSIEETHEFDLVLSESGNYCTLFLIEKAVSETPSEGIPVNASKEKKSLFEKVADVRPEILETEEVAEVEEIENVEETLEEENFVTNNAEEVLEEETFNEENVEFTSIADETEDEEEIW